MENSNRLSQWYPVALKSFNLLRHYEEIRIAVKALEIKFRHNKQSVVWVPIMCFLFLFKTEEKKKRHKDLHPLLKQPKRPKLHRSQINHTEILSQHMNFSYGNSLFAFWMFLFTIKSYNTSYCVLWAILNEPNLALSYFLSSKTKCGIK